MLKVGIIFYSFSGNTKKACEFLSNKLKEQQCDADLIELKLEREEKSFLKQCRDARAKKIPKILNENCDVSKYDFIIFASPIWAFTFAPALRAFLTKAQGLSGKRAACCFTHGSSLGANKALRELEDILRIKDAHVQFSKSISGAKTNKAEYLEQQYKDLLEIAKP